MEQLIEFLTKLFGQGSIDAILIAVAVIVSFLIALANLITMFFPSVKESKVYNVIMKILNTLALNVLKNKNADDAK